MKFYKILRKDMKHHNFKYQEGLNVDTIPFSPFGSCRPGGLYFSREDILAFLSYGEYIAEVVIPEDAQVYENPADVYDKGPKKWKADKIILGPRERVTHKVIKRLIKEGAAIDDFGMEETALSWAARNNKINIAKVLIKAGANCDHYYTLKTAVRYNHPKIVKLLIEGGANIKNHPRVFEMAVGNDYDGRIEMLKMFIESVSNDLECLKEYLKKVKDWDVPEIEKLLKKHIRALKKIQKENAKKEENSNEVLQNPA